MLDALRDISPKVDSKEASEQPRDSQTSTIPKEPEADPLSFLSASPNEEDGAFSPPDVDVSSEQEQVLDARTSSTASLSSSDSNRREQRSEPSENGTETEEDEGMVLVGRPA